MSIMKTCFQKPQNKYADMFTVLGDGEINS